MFLSKNMENILQNIYQIENDKYKCPICHEIAFPPVKWWVSKPVDPNITPCNHIYCLECTRTFFQLNRKISDRTVNRFECLICQQQLIHGTTATGVPKNANDVYYHCSYDDYKIVKLLVELETNGLGKKCIETNCNYTTTCPNDMRNHCKNECLVSNMKCIHPGCNFTSTRVFLSEHEKNCVFKPLQCKLCKIKKNRNDLVYHYYNYHKVEHNIDSIFDKHNE